MRVLLSRTGCLVTIVWVAAIAGLQAQQVPLTSTVLMPVPRLMWFSGVFRPADNLPVAPVENVTVAVYREREGGDVIWLETQDVAMDASGRYNLLMGSTFTEGMPLELFTSGEPRWIGITVNRPGEVEQPRLHQASVPYALKAADADTLGGYPASAYLLAPTAGTSDPPAASAGSVKDASVATVQPSAGTADLVLAGTTNFLAKYVNSADVGNSAVYETSGNVGIGTTTPLDSLHLRFTNTGGSATGLAVQNLGNTAASYSGMLFYDQFGALGQFQGFNNVTHEYRINNVASAGSINFMIGSSSKFLVANSGNIGLGVSAPGSKLDVEGDINTTTQYNIGGNRVLSVTGSQNTFAGSGAGLVNTGSNNSFVGRNAGSNNTGSFNSFFGRIAGSNNTGSNNAFFGDGIGQSNTGGENAFFGKDAGFNNTTGFRNAFLGKSAGYANGMGFDNSSVGFQAGSSTINSCCNSYFGSFSGNSNTPGNNNTLIGYAAEFGTAALTNATAIGAQAMVSQSNSLILGSIAGQNFAAADTKVGIGTNAPVSKLHLRGVGSDGTGQTDVRITGTGQIASGITLDAIGTGGRAYSLLSTADNSGGGGFGPGAFGVFDVTGGIYRLVIESDGDVGVGTFFPDRKLSVNGGASKVGGGSWDVYSDERLKHITGPFTPGLNAVMQLQPVRYEYKPDNALGLESGGEHIGFGAQAVQKIIPEAVTTNDRGYLLVNNDPILWTMLNAIQEQQKEIQDQRHKAEQHLSDVQQQQADIRALQQQNADLQQRLASLEAVLAGRR